jgi:hypothetical protein
LRKTQIILLPLRNEIRRQASYPKTAHILDTRTGDPIVRAIFQVIDLDSQGCGFIRVSHAALRKFLQIQMFHRRVQHRKVSQGLIIN